MTKQEMLCKIREAREMLSRCWIPNYLDDSNGGHCQWGCLRVIDLRNSDALCDLIGVAAGRLYPEFADESIPKMAGIRVNNNLGKAAILAVFDDVIAALEVAVLYEEETAKHAARAEFQDAVEIERYAASLRVDSIGE